MQVYAFDVTSFTLQLRRAGICPLGRLRPPVLMKFCRPNGVMEVPRPVGTRGWVGWMRGPCACPRGSATILLHGTQANRVATRTSTRPPPVPASTPCPYRTRADVSNHFPNRLSKIIRVGAGLAPALVRALYVTRFAAPGDLLPQRRQRQTSSIGRRRYLSVRRLQAPGCR